MNQPSHDIDIEKKKGLFSQLTVLSVEDNPNILRLPNQVLRALGVAPVLQANDANMAFQYLDARTIDIITCGLQMEPMDRFEFTRQVRRSLSYRQPWLPIVILSGFSDLDQFLEARDAGATEFVTKPFAPKTLFKRIADAIERPRLFVQVDDYYGPCRRRRKSTDYDGPERRSQHEQKVTDVAGERARPKASRDAQPKQAAG
jgi:two-component system chemotaxis response regulator CheY